MSFGVWRNVVLPSIRGDRHIVTVLLVIGAAQVFTQIFEITKGGPYNSTQSLMTYMYTTGLLQLRLRLRSGPGVAVSGPYSSVFSAAEIRILRQHDV